MKLRYSPPSPFVRKVRVAAAILGLTDRIELVPAATKDPNDSLRTENPLGKLPVMILDDGETLFDSRVIAAYLDDLAGGGRLHPAPPALWPALRLQALADGMMDATLMQIYESRYRPPEKRHPDWVQYQADKLARAMRSLEASPPPLDGDLHIGHVALACSLGYLDIRMEGKWRADFPSLVGWLDRFESLVPAFAETAPPADWTG